jgi:hypothetical protein
LKFGIFLGNIPQLLLNYQQHLLPFINLKTNLFLLII